MLEMYADASLAGDSNAHSGLEIMARQRKKMAFNKEVKQNSVNNAHELPKPIAD